MGTGICVTRTGRSAFARASAQRHSRLRNYTKADAIDALYTTRQMRVPQWCDIATRLARDFCLVVNTYNNPWLCRQLTQFTADNKGNAAGKWPTATTT